MIEENVGLRRDYSAFELTKALSIKDSLKAYKIVSFFAESQKRFPIQKTMGALSSHFLKILKFHAYSAARYDRTEICSRLGINPYFYKEYEMAARLYPLNKTMRIMGLLKEYDYRSKSNMRGVSDDGALLTELISKILN
ncbi:MAG: hypothetical protein HUJ90_00385 [Bacteroidales bacterium]|nr:hypothetical protein [Bacteroidales bacterium]